MKIAVLVSGGVDSSVALVKLVEQGHRDITAFYLKIWLEDELAYLGDCPWQDDLEYVRATCDLLKVPLQVVSLQSEYWQEVVSYTIAELKAGRTPSPDILCNQRIKFGAFLRYLGPDFDKIASGHYADIDWQDNVALLKRGTDPIKDQAYFLSHLSQVQLQKCLFPIGVYRKSEVRSMAVAHALPSMKRPDSQGICFLGKIKFNEFVKFHLGENPGQIREWESERVLGEHKGYWFHTIGQRKGLSLSGGPWFVIKKDIARNIVYVSHNETFMGQARNTLSIREPHWISGAPKKRHLQVKIRHGAKSYDCEVDYASDATLGVQLAGKDSGVAPGQFAVFYDGDYCLGGGVIC